MSRRTILLLILFLNMLVWVAVRELNSILSPLALYLHLEVLLVIFSVIYLRTLPGFFLAIGSSLIVGATRPPPMEHAVLMVMTLWALGMWARRHVRRDNVWHLAGFAVGAQSLVLLLAGLVLFPQALDPGAYFLRLFLDLGVSALALAVLAPLWARFQVQLLWALGWRIQNETKED